MRIDLAELTAPAHTAIVTQECQGAVIDNMLSLLATVTTTDDLLEVWQPQ